MSTKQTLALLTHNNTMKKKDPEGAVVFTLQTAPNCHFSCKKS